MDSSMITFKEVLLHNANKKTSIFIELSMQMKVCHENRPLLQLQLEYIWILKDNFNVDENAVRLREIMLLFYAFHTVAQLPRTTFN